MNIIQVVVIALIATIMIILLKQYKPEFSLLISLVTCFFIFAFSFEKIETLISLIENMITKSGVKKEFFEILIKALGISYLIDFASNLCIDAGEKAIASKIEFAGKLIITTMAVPIITTLLETIVEVI